MAQDKRTYVGEGKSMDHALIVEDLAEAQAWLQQTLLSVYPSMTIRIANTLAMAKEMAAHHEPDLALVDIGLPDGSGIDLIDELNRRNAETVCIVTSVFDDDQHLFAALRAGAKGYVLKDQSKQELAEMLKGIIGGQPLLSPAIARRLIDFFQPETNTPTLSENLTGREEEVLTLISKGYTVAKVAEMLGITRNTTAGYVKIIYRKLNVSSRAEATLEATRLGIVSRNNF